MAITKDELKTVAATSAIAAAGSALATTIVGMVVDRYFSSQREAGPTFVVVPVVDRPVPPLPPGGGEQVAGLGALSQASRQAAVAALPSCYTASLHRCLNEDPTAAACRRYDPILAAYEEDDPATEELIDALPYCEYGADEMRRNVIVGAAGGAAAGALLAAILAS